MDHDKGPYSKCPITVFLKYACLSKSNNYTIVAGHQNEHIEERAAPYITFYGTVTDTKG